MWQSLKNILYLQSRRLRKTHQAKAAYSKATDNDDMT